MYSATELLMLEFISYLCDETDSMRYVDLQSFIQTLRSRRTLCTLQHNYEFISYFDEIGRNYDLYSKSVNFNYLKWVFNK